ncbi:hypothetical protein KI387_022575, partial [Taxus chinensis]
MDIMRLLFNEPARINEEPLVAAAAEEKDSQELFKCINYVPPCEPAKLFNVKDEEEETQAMNFFMKKQEEEEFCKLQPPVFTKQIKFPLPKPNRCKNVVSERARRLRLNRLLCTLRSKVPNISKMNKKSTLSDAIEYVEELQRETMKLDCHIKRLEENILTASSLQKSGVQNCNKYNVQYFTLQMDNATVRVIGKGVLEVIIHRKKQHECGNYGAPIFGLVDGVSKAMESLSLRIFKVNISRHQVDSFSFWV